MKYCYEKKYPIILTPPKALCMQIYTGFYKQKNREICTLYYYPGRWGIKGRD